MQLIGINPVIGVNQRTGRRCRTRFADYAAPGIIGKTYLACALGHQACRDGFRAQYFHARKLFRSLEAAHADGSLARLKSLARLDLFIIGDLGLATAKSKPYRDLLEVIDDRIGRGATLLTSQYPVAQWHDLIGDATVADALLKSPGPQRLSTGVERQVAARFQIRSCGLAAIALGEYDRGVGHPKTGPRRTPQTASSGSKARSAAALPRFGMAHSAPLIFIWTAGASPSAPSPQSRLKNLTSIRTAD